MMLMRNLTFISQPQVEGVASDVNERFYSEVMPEGTEKINLEIHK